MGKGNTCGIFLREKENEYIYIYIYIYIYMHGFRSLSNKAGNGRG